MGNPVQNNVTNQSGPISFQKSFSSPAYNKPMGTGFTQDNELAAWLEEALKYANSPEAKNLNAQEWQQLNDWIAYAQSQLGGSNWGNAVPNTYAPMNEAQGYQNLPQPGAEPNGAKPGAAENWYINGNTVDIQYVSGDPSNQWPTDVWGEQVTLTLDSIVDTDVSLGVDPATGDEILIIKITDAATGQEKIIRVHDPKTTPVFINAVKPDKVKVDANVKALGLVEVGKYKGESQGTQPTEYIDGVSIYKDGAVDYYSYDGQDEEAYFTPTSSITIHTDPNDKVTLSEEKYKAPGGQTVDALKVVIQHDDGTTDTLYIRKVKGLSINLPEALEENITNKNLLEDIQKFQAYNGIHKALNISYGNMPDLDKQESLESAAETLDVKIEEILNNEDLKKAIENGNLAEEDLVQLKALADTLNIDMENLLKNDKVMECFYNEQYSKQTLENAVALAEEMGLKGEEGLAALFDDKVMGELEDPDVPPSKEFIDFLLEYDSELSATLKNPENLVDLWKNEGSNNTKIREELTTRLVELFNIAYEGSGKQAYTHFSTGDHKSGYADNIKIVDEDGDFSYFEVIEEDWDDGSGNGSGNTNTYEHPSGGIGHIILQKLDDASEVVY